MKIFLLFFSMSFLLIGCSSKNEQTDQAKEITVVNLVTGDPLPSWNEGELKKSIIQYVTEIADSTSRKFIPVADRIATFDK